MRTLTIIRNISLALFILVLSLSPPGQASGQECLVEEEMDWFEGYEDCWLCHTLDCTTYVCSNGAGVICYG